MNRVLEEINPARRRFLSTAALTIGAIGLGTMALAKTRSGMARELASIADASAWLNSQPLTVADLDRKVVLVDFWTYSCINWRRQLPYVRAWAEKYKNSGLIVVGVHAPEFSFEKNIENVRWAVRDMRIEYPIALDNGREIWRAFDNEYWPALYFIDARGHLRHHVFGEGQYDQSEIVIQRLLAESGNSGISNDMVSIDARGAEAVADWDELGSGENYVGYERTENFASPGGIRSDKPHLYVLASQLRRNQWALSGHWTIGKEATVLTEPNGRTAYRFHARDLHLVMGPATQNIPVRFQVRIDGEPPRASHGVDVDEKGHGTVSEPRMYQLIRQPKPVMDRLFEIQFLDGGVAAYSFTFG